MPRSSLSWASDDLTPHAAVGAGRIVSAAADAATVGLRDDIWRNTANGIAKGQPSAT